MPDYAALRSELTGDPLALGYGPMTDTQAAAKINATDTGRTLPRTNVPTTEIMAAIADAAWPAVGSLSESKLQTVLALPFVDASSANIRAILGAVFPNSGGTAATRTALLALGTRTVSRAEELGLGVVTVVDVARARSGAW